MEVGSIEYIATINTAKYKSGAKDIEKANRDMEGSTQVADKSTSRFGASLQSFASRGVKVAAVGMATLATTIATMTIRGGISRALNIEDAQAKLRGLGHDAASVKSIMDNALTSVKGTAFGLGEAATTAAGAVAAGIKPGTQLEGVLKTVANSAALAGTDMSEMGAIFNKVATSNKVQMDVINQLGDRGVPVIQFLAKELGKTAEETVKLASAGKINFATFEKAMRTGVGDAAVEMGKTTRGSWQNMLAALSRVGEKIVSGPISQVRGGFGRATQFLDDNSVKIVATVEKMIGFVNRSFEALGNARPKIIEVAKAIGKQLSPGFQRLADSIISILPTAQRLLKEVIVPLAVAFGTTLVLGIKGTLDILSTFINIAGPVINWMLDNKWVVLALAAAFVAVKTAMLISDTFTAYQQGLGNIAASATIANGAIGGASGQVRGLQSLLKTPITMNVAVAGALAAIALAQLAADKFWQTMKNAYDTTIGAVRAAEQAEIAAKRAAVHAQSAAGGDTTQQIRDLYMAQQGASFSRRATGGPVSAGRAYLVGENRDGTINDTTELFVPNQSGRIINSKQLQSALGNGDGAGITNNIQQVTIASEVDGERWLRRLSGNQEIVSNGLVPTQSYM